VLRTVCRKGPDGPRTSEFPKSFSYPDSQLRFDIDELMHLRNKQLRQTS
jgi:hypothetical protein